MYEIYCDGASRSNPGDASIGVSINKDKVEIDTIKKKIGINTNNVAEYLGLIAALEYCVENKVNNVRIFLDSLLVVQQVNMEYKVKSKKLQTHYEKSLKLIDQIEDIEIHHIRREFNSRADQLANEALDEI
ncbi:ribonuclease HI family protein [bacterium]|jgi:ribonuclease HI|nr:ribonuclease HI family protein [bacterium]MDC2989074.1 ribonuclease HI family protein [Acidimicrobiaceae bacterium]MEC8329165.1 ribonuclease HI family protein [Actinomycetota bacterium]|tara:strand:+ start:829 stop:1221 length:393 start_codon:yes stop_codon:yes gene_type:complete